MTQYITTGVYEVINISVIENGYLITWTDYTGEEKTTFCDTVETCTGFIKETIGES